MVKVFKGLGKVGFKGCEVLLMFKMLFKLEYLFFWVKGSLVGGVKIFLVLFVFSLGKLSWIF